MLKSIATRGLLSMTLLCGACSEEIKDAEAVKKVAPVSLMQLPVSARAAGAFDGLEVDIASDAIRAGDVEVKLSNGALPKQYKGGAAIDSLVAAFRGKAMVALRAKVTTPFATAVSVLASAQAAGVSQMGFVVRKANDTSASYSLFRGAKVVTPETAPLKSMLWDAFMPSWSAMQQACEGGARVDCAAPIESLSKGGDAELRLFVRGRGVSVEVIRDPASVPKPAAGGGGGELLDGIANAPAATEGEPEQELPAIATFMWRLDEALKGKDSAVAKTLQPLCGSSPCKIRIVTDAETQIMPVVSFVGAAFPTGSTEPLVEFQVNK